MILVVRVFCWEQILVLSLNSFRNNKCINCLGEQELTYSERQC